MFREQAEAHFLAGMKYPLPKDAQRTPPVACEFAVGDVVTFTNEAGVQFFNRTITGFAPVVDYGRFIYWDNAAWWFATSPERFTKQTPKEGPLLECASALASKYGFDASNEYLLGEYESYVQRVSEGEPMDFDDWLAGSDIPEIVQAREKYLHGSTSGQDVVERSRGG